jgi:putative transposase
MRCVACDSSAISERSEHTVQGYRRFRCRTCGKQFNERSTGVLNRTQYPSDVVALVVLWRLRDRLSLRDLAEMFLLRGIVFSYEAVRDWEAKLTPALAEDLRRRRLPRQSREELVRRRDLCQNPRRLVLFVSCHRQIGRADGREVKRNT